MTIDKNFGEEILHKIKDENIQPKPKWQFLLKNYVVWGMGVFSLFFGSISMSLIFFMLRYNNWEVYGRADSDFWEVIFLAVPLFWIACLTLFTVVVWYNVKHTKTGYRYSPVLIIAVVIVASVIFGGIFFAVGVDEKIDDVLGRRAPFYNQIINPHIDFWFSPAKGRLTGLIVAQTNIDQYTLVDQGKNEWQVLTQNTKKNSEAELKIGRPARLLGLVQSDHIFVAKEVLSMRPGEGFLRGRIGQLPSEFFGTTTPEMNRINKNQNLRGMPGQFIEFLEKYPELKTEFIKNLLDNKDKVKEIIKRDPELIKNLQTLNIDEETLKKLQE